MHVLVVQFSCFFFFRLTVCLSQGKISRSVGLQKESDVPEPCWHYETTTTVTLKSLIQPLSFLNETKQIKRPLTVPPNQPNNPFNFQQNSTQKTKNTTKPKPFDQMLSKTQRQTTPPTKKNKGLSFTVFLKTYCFLETIVLKKTRLLLSRIFEIF